MSGVPIMQKIFLVVLTVFMAVNAYAYDYKDAIRETAPHGQGVDASLAFVNYLGDVLAFGEADNEAEAFFKELVNGLSHFSFEKLYNSDYFSDWPNGYRGVSFRADFQPDKYDYRMVPHDQTLKNRSELVGIGAFISEFGLRKNQDSPTAGNSYSLLFEGDAISANLSHENILRTIDNLLRISDPDNLALLVEQTGSPDRPVMAQLSKDFPRFSSIDGIVNLQYDPTLFWEDGEQFNYFTLTLGFHKERLKELYPGLAKYMKNLVEPGYLDIKVINEKGHLLTRFQVDFKEHVVRLSHCTKQGKVVPYKIRKDKITPFWEDAFTFSSLEKHNWVSHAEFFNISHGIKLKINNIVVAGDYLYNKEDMDFKITLDSLPQPEISGAVYGFIPLPIVDLFIPGTIQGLADDFAKVMTKANYGAGSYFALDWHQVDPSFWWLHWKTETEMADSFLVRTGARIIAKKYRMNEKTMEELYRFTSTSVKYFAEDLEDMRE